MEGQPRQAVIAYIADSHIDNIEDEGSNQEGDAQAWPNEQHQQEEFPSIAHFTVFTELSSSMNIDAAQVRSIIDLLTEAPRNHSRQAMVDENQPEKTVRGEAYSSSMLVDVSDTIRKISFTNSETHFKITKPATKMIVYGVEDKFVYSRIMTLFATENIHTYYRICKDFCTVKADSTGILSDCYPVFPLSQMPVPSSVWPSGKIASNIAVQMKQFFQTLKCKVNFDPQMRFVELSEKRVLDANTPTLLFLMDIPIQFYEMMALTLHRTLQNSYTSELHTHRTLEYWMYSITARGEMEWTSWMNLVERQNEF